MSGPLFKKGDRVRIKTGVFKDHAGTVYDVEGLRASIDTDLGVDGVKVDIFHLERLEKKL